MGAEEVIVGVPPAVRRAEVALEEVAEEEDTVEVPPVVQRVAEVEDTIKRAAEAVWDIQARMGGEVQAQDV